jgi:light-regulated signal transduction histidine kinase (bacteriophytochrome)
MTENIVEVGTRHVGEIRNINRELTEKALHMRCLSYMSQIKSTLLTETIYEIDESKKVLLDTNKQLLGQKETIERQNLLLNEKNKELRAFSHSVSHDLQGPIRRIEGFAKILLEDYKHNLDDQAIDYLRRISDSALNMAQLIDSMMRLGRVSYHQLSVKDVNLSDLARKIVRQLRQDEPHRDVNVKIKQDIVVKGDKNLLELVLQNLLGNAWKFTRKVSPSNIEFGEIKRDGQRTFYIKDNGVGFDPKETAKLFKEFSRLHDKQDFPGTGIGLAIAHRIITRHGGEIWAEPGKQGATFYFRLRKNIESVIDHSGIPANTDKI